jgi:tripartite motif-containing protein 71
VHARRLTTLCAALLALLALGPATASADGCPGASGACPYTSAGIVGQRGEGVLRFPQAVAIGPDGSVYVADQGSHLIQVFGPDGTFRRDVGVAGTRPGELSAGVGALTVTADGTLIVADGGANRIDRYGPDGSFVGAFVPGPDLGRFHFGAGVGNDAAAGGGLAVSGNTLYVVDSGNQRVLRFTTDGGNGAQIVPPGLLANPRGIAVRGTRLLIADDQHHRIVVTDTGGHLLKTIGAGQGAGAGQLNFPYGVAVDPQGRVFVADDMNQRIVRYSAGPNYPYKARWGSYGTGAGQLAYPRGLAVDANGLVYVANTGNDRIDVFDRSGALLRSFGAGQFDAPLGVAADAAGYRAVADSINGRIEILNPDGSVATMWGSPNPGPTVLRRPVAVAFDGAGNAYVLDQVRARIVVFARSSGQPVASIGSPGSGPGELLSPSALAIDAGGTISVADSGNARIARFTTDGTYLGSTAVPDEPRGIAVTPDGSRTYVSDVRNRITVYAPDGTQLAQFGGTGSKLGKLGAPAQMTLDGAGNLWVAERGNNRVQEFGPNGERLLVLGTRGTDAGTFVHPTGVSVDCNGLLTVTDSDNNRVQQFALAAPPPTGCGQLPALGTPPPPQVPTLPAPDGPQVTLRALRTAKLLRTRMLPLRVGCDTTCALEVDAVVAPRTRPRKGHKPVSAKLRTVKMTIPAGQSKIVRLTLSRRQAALLTRALARHRGLTVSVSLTATAAAGAPTELTDRVLATA